MRQFGRDEPVPLLSELPLRFDVDGVLRAQGADPAQIRNRHPDLVAVAEQAMAEAGPLLQPTVLYQRHAVINVRHSQLRLAGGARLKGQLLVEHLGAAREVIAVLCTVGGALEARSSAVFADDPVLGLALDGVGVAAVEALTVAAASYFEQEAVAQGYGISLPLSPGMNGWPLEEGQPQLMKLLPTAETDVRLTMGGVLLPGKSLTLLLGVGLDVETKGSICDYCALRARCVYRDRFHFPEGVKQC